MYKTIIQPVNLWDDVSGFPEVITPACVGSGQEVFNQPHSNVVTPDTHKAALQYPYFTVFSYFF